jgi:hypothetical protein
MYRWLSSGAALSEAIAKSKRVRHVSKPPVSKIIFVTRIALLIGGFDTPSAIASGYSTTELLINLFDLPIKPRADGTLTGFSPLRAWRA